MKKKILVVAMVFGAIFVFERGNVSESMEIIPVLNNFEVFKDMEATGIIPPILPMPKPKNPDQKRSMQYEVYS